MWHFKIVPKTTYNVSSGTLSLCSLTLAERNLNVRSACRLLLLSLFCFLVYSDFVAYFAMINILAAAHRQFAVACSLLAKISSKFVGQNVYFSNVV